ncbi:hypothetical protein M3Y97_00935900 [Aphelenchoides bicaudatus]|nr:hypothetical protein M3Y97_00935900 [Aphelenchoides bicaudatus]
MHGHKCLAPWKCRMKMLSDRYAIDTFKKDEKIEFVLIDLIYGEQRLLKSDVKEPDDELYGCNDAKIQPLNSEYFLYFREYEAGCGYISLCIYLLKIDYSNFTCSLLDQRRTSGALKAFFFDDKDPKSFVLFTEDEYTRLFWGSWADSWLDNLYYVKHADDLYHDHATYRLKGNWLYGLDFEHGKGISILKIPLFETDYRGYDPEEQTTVSINIDGIDESLFIRSRYVWHKKDAYALCKSNQLIKIDSIKKEATLIEIPSLGEVRDFRIDDKGHFIACEIDKDSKKHIVKRFLIDQPYAVDTLFNLCVQKLGQDIDFLSKEAYKKRFKELPPKFRPFGDNCFPVNNVTKYDLVQLPKRARLFEPV